MELTVVDDGFTWREQGVAKTRPPEPQVGWGAVSRPDVLVWTGRYSIDYQGYTQMSGLWGDDGPRRPQPLGSTQGTYAGLVCNSTISLYIPPLDIRDSCVPTSVTWLS
jgi:hypothetical protein